MDRTAGGFTSRLPWSAAPEPLRRQVDRICGGSQVGTDVHGGMSPGPAAVLSLRDGSRVFVKAVSDSLSTRSHANFVREAVALRAMPRGAPAPHLLGVAEWCGWIALVMSCAPGAAAGPPWTAGGVPLVARACEATSACVAPAVVPPILDLLTDLDGWAKLAAGQAGPLDGWEAAHGTQLAARAEGWGAWTAGTWLVHQDIRADNAIVDHRSGCATLVDWSYCCAGANYLDRARLAADVVCTGHEDGPEAALAVALAILAPLPDEAARFVIALAGMWRYRSTLPPLPGSPTLRHWQYERARAIRPLLAALIQA
jgi:hypothetical protein